MKSHLQKRGASSWRAKYEVGVDAQGRRQTRYLTLRGTRRQVEAELAKIVVSVNAGTHVDPSTETVGSFKER
jgi:hypothetical protein